MKNPSVVSLPIGTYTKFIYCEKAVGGAGRGAHLHEAHPNSAHFGEFIHCLETVVHRLRQQLSKFLVVEDFQAAAAGDLADGGGVEAVVVVAVPALHEDAAVTEALGIDFSANVIKVDACRRAQHTSQTAGRQAGGVRPGSSLRLWQNPQVTTLSCVSQRAREITKVSQKSESITLSFQ